nr:GNAT family N-acetyltransferase [Streptomyces sp. HNM0574]
MPPGHGVTVARLPGGAVFSLRCVHPTADAPLVHSWMNDPDVARFWQLAHPPGQIEAYLRQQLASSYSTPFVGCLDGEPSSYWELYRADLAPFATLYTARRHDAGLRLLIGPHHSRGRGLGARLLRAVSDWQLSLDPYASRVVAEPDVRDVRGVRAHERAGFRKLRELDLPGKRAAFMARERPA